MWRNKPELPNAQFIGVCVYIYIYIYVCVCVCVCLWMGVFYSVTPSLLWAFSWIIEWISHILKTLLCLQTQLFIGVCVCVCACVCACLCLYHTFNVLVSSLYCCVLFSALWLICRLYKDCFCRIPIHFLWSAIFDRRAQVWLFFLRPLSLLEPNPQFILCSHSKCHKSYQVWYHSDEAVI